MERRDDFDEAGAKIEPPDISDGIGEPAEKNQPFGIFCDVQNSKALVTVPLSARQSSAGKLNRPWPETQAARGQSLYQRIVGRCG